AQLFELVAAVDRYPEFLPWCLAARIRSNKRPRDEPQKTSIVADLVIGARMIRERYTSRVTLQRPDRIDVTCVEGPFRYLTSRWTFEPVAASAKRPLGGTMLTFDIEFEFRSTLLQSLMAVFFDAVATRTITAFADRAKQLYGARGRSALGADDLLASGNSLHPAVDPFVLSSTK